MFTVMRHTLWALLPGDGKNLTCSNRLDVFLPGIVALLLPIAAIMISIGLNLVLLARKRNRNPIGITESSAFTPNKSAIAFWISLDCRLRLPCTRYFKSERNLSLELYVI